MQTEGLNIIFAKPAVHRIAEIAWQVNEQTENIGARRLHTVMERLLEKLSFDATDIAQGPVARVTMPTLTNICRTSPTIRTFPGIYSNYE